MAWKSFDPILISLVLFNPVKDISIPVSVSSSDSTISEFQCLLGLYVTFVLLPFNVHSYSNSVYSTFRSNLLYKLRNVSTDGHRKTAGLLRR